MKKKLCVGQAGHKHEVVQLASEEAMQYARLNSTELRQYARLNATELRQYARLKATELRQYARLNVTELHYEVEAVCPFKLYGVGSMPSWIRAAFLSA